MEDQINLKPESEKSKLPMTIGKAKANTSKWLSIVLALLLVAALAFLAWYWMQAEADKKRLTDERAQLQSQLDSLKYQNANKDNPVAVDKTCHDTATAAMKENIKAALDSQNTAAFSTYTANPVNYVVAASELSKDMTPDEAAVALEYTHTATGPWDFSLPVATINTWKAGFYVDHFDDATRYIGRAASGMVVSFDFDCSGKIDKIFVAADDDLLL